LATWIDRRAVRLAGELAIVLALLALALATFGVARAKPDGDEAEWIGTAYYFDTLFVRRDISPDAWPDTYWTRTQPMVARYAIGAWLSARGYELGTFNPDHDHSKDWSANQRAGSAPTTAMLDEARRAMRGLAALTAVWLYLAVRLVAGPLGGSVASLLVIGSPYLNEHLIRAKGDTTLMFFWMAALAALVGGLRLRESHRRASLGLAALGGVLFGLAFGAKLTGALGILALAAWTVLAVLGSLRRCRAARAATFGAATFGAVALAAAALAFVASNPFLYPDPIGRTALLFRNRSEEMARQMREEPHRAVVTVQDRIFQTWDRSLFNEAWGPSHLGRPVEMVLAVLGFGWLAVRAGRRRLGAEALLVLSAVGAFGGIAWGLGYRLQHYFVPSAIVGDLLAGVGVGFACRLALAALRSRRPADDRRATAATVASGTPGARAALADG